jgi:hypothetical protein
MNWDPNDGWERYNDQQEMAAVAEQMEDLHIVLSQLGFAFNYVDWSSDKLWFHPMEEADIEFERDQFTGERYAKNCECMEAEIQWVDNGDMEVDLVETAANVIAVILGYLPPRPPARPNILNIDRNPRELYCE